MKNGYAIKYVLVYATAYFVVIQQFVYSLYVILSMTIFNLSFCRVSVTLNINSMSPQVIHTYCLFLFFS